MIDHVSIAVRDLAAAAAFYERVLGTLGYATGTGLAPFLSIIKDPEVYDRFEKIVLMHGVRFVNGLAYADYIERELPDVKDRVQMVRDVLRSLGQPIAIPEPA